MRIPLITASLLALAACQQDTPPTGTTPPDMDQSCIAPTLQDAVGQNRSVLGGRDLPEPTRIIGPGMAVTMDYRPDRLNIEYDRNNIIVRIYCG